MSTLVRLAETGTVCVPKLGVNSLGREYWLPLEHVASWHSCFGGRESGIHASLQVQVCHLISPQVRSSHTTTPPIIIGLARPFGPLIRPALVPAGPLAVQAQCRVPSDLPCSRGMSTGAALQWVARISSGPDVSYNLHDSLTPF